jgi:hypothetical protein
MRFELFSFSILPKRHYEISIISFISADGERRYSLLAIWWRCIDGLRWDILFIAYWFGEWLIHNKSVEVK